MLSYAGDPGAVPRRPILRVLRGADGVPQDFVLPGAAHGYAHWLGLIPPDTREIRLSAGPGFALERVGARREVSVLAQCLLRRPWRFVSALYERARGSERRYRDTLRGACAVTPLTQYRSWAASRDRPVRAVPTDLRIRCLVLTRSGEAAALAATLDALAVQGHPAHSIGVAWEDARPASPDPRAAHQIWDDRATAADLIAGATPLCLLGPATSRPPTRSPCWRRPWRGWISPTATNSAPTTGRGSSRIGARISPSPPATRAARPCSRARCSTGCRPQPLGSMAEAVLAIEAAAIVAGARGAHVPRVLARTTSDVLDPPARARALAARLEGLAAPVRAAFRNGAIQLDWPLPSPAPRASIVIPSRDRLDLIERVCRGVLHETAYADLELIIVDNGSTDPAVLAHYDELRRDPRVRILIDPRPFNFAAMVNDGVAAATGAIVVLLNNDVAVLDPGWLDAMVRQASRPEVGAVGAKLLYADGTLQHAGVVVGLGGRAGHILRRRPGDTPGHLGRLRVAHEVSAVTAACLAVSRDKYLASAASTPNPSRWISTMSISACGWAPPAGRRSGPVRHPGPSRIRQPGAVGRGQARPFRAGSRPVLRALARCDPPRSVLPSRPVAHDLRRGSRMMRRP